MAFINCAKCRICDGAAYQSIPPWACGNLESSVIIVGQNPGEIKSDKVRLDLARRVTEYVETSQSPKGDVVSFWYNWDFGTSHGAKQMEAVFGENWTEKYAFTNAVRCRTQDNAAPSEQMQHSCVVWTNELVVGFSAIIMMGNIAKRQILGKSTGDVTWGKGFKSAKDGTLMMAIPHYVTWKSEMIEQYRNEFIRILDELNSKR